MIRNTRSTLFFIVAVLLFGIGLGTNQTHAQKAKNAFSEVGMQQPLYGDYKGVRIGMAADEVRAKLGQAMLKGDAQDFYVFSDKETAQIAYDTAHKVFAISVDYLDGVGAPDYRSVVGPDIELRSNGSMYKRVIYDQLGFWVSYNRSVASPVVMVTITIQSIKLDRTRGV